MNDQQSLQCSLKPPVAQQKVTIHYCNLCRWQFRANWLQQELLSTFIDEIDEVALQPGNGGVFRIWLNETLVWDRVSDDGFPEAKTLKRRIRDLLCPERDLGHIDRVKPASDA